MQEQRETIYIDSRKPQKETFNKDILVMVALLAAFVLLLTPFFPDGIYLAVVCLASSATLAARIAGKNHRFFSVVVIAAVIFVIAFLFSSFSRGLISFLNQIINAVSIKFNLDIISFSESASPMDKTVFFALICMAAAVAVERLTTWNRTWAAAIFEFLLFEFFSVVNIRISPLTVAVYTATLLILWIKNTDYKNDVRGACVVVAFSLGVGLIAGLAVGDYGGSQTTHNLQQGVSKSVNAIRYGENDLPDGDLTKAYDMEIGAEEKLIVKSSRLAREYLGGFTASDFDDGRVWRVHKGETFSGEWEGIFRWLAQEGFYSQYARDVNAHTFSETHERQEISVKNVGASRKYLYVSYGLREVTHGRFNIKDDLTVRAKGFFGEKEYTFVSLDSESIDHDLLDLIQTNRFDASMYDYLQSQNVYTGFVNDNYTNLDEELKDELTEIFFNSDFIDNDSSLYSAVSRIRAVMSLRVKYSRSPTHYDGKEEFVHWFLNEAQSGNSAYFATAGAMALRAIGYPTRYVEGYITDGTKTTQTLTGLDSHAWAEVYLENMGWIPVEFTPSFYSSNVYNEQVVEISMEVAGGATGEKSPLNLSEEYSEEAKTSAALQPTIPIRVILLSLIGIMLLTAMVVFCRCVFIRKRRKKWFASDNAEVYIFGYIMKMILLCGIDCKIDKPLECADKIEKLFGIVVKMEYLRIVSIMQKSAFGGEKPTESEMRTIRLFTGKLKRNLYKNNKGIRRLKLKLIDVI